MRLVRRNNIPVLIIIRNLIETSLKTGQGRAEEIAAEVDNDDDNDNNDDSDHNDRISDDNKVDNDKKADSSEEDKAEDKDNRDFKDIILY